MEERLQLLRKAFGSFMTGVTVTTMMKKNEEPLGFTANSFTSVSLDPPLLLVCLGNSSCHIADFSGSEYFGVNILSADQVALSERFSAGVKDRFLDVSWQKGRGGVPLLAGVIAWFVCKTTHTVDAGDHQIIIGEVEDFAMDEKTGKGGLGYYKGNYFSLANSKERWD